MNFVISCNDERYNQFMSRVPSSITNIVRINITPENMGEEVPWWFKGSPDRWAVTCAIVSALQQALDAGEDCHLFEDDCIFDENFDSKYTEFITHLPEDWCQAYLGGQILTKRLYPLIEVEGNEFVLRTRCAHRNHAWIARLSSIQRLIDWINTPIWPNDHTADWRICYLHLQQDFVVYIPKNDWMCGQGASLSMLDKLNYPDRWWWIDDEKFMEEDSRIRDMVTAQFAERARLQREAEAQSKVVATTSDEQGSAAEVS